MIPSERDRETGRGGSRPSIRIQIGFLRMLFTFVCYELTSGVLCLLNSQLIKKLLRFLRWGMIKDFVAGCKTLYSVKFIS